jgi:hypothetical protein
VTGADMRPSRVARATNMREGREPKPWGSNDTIKRSGGEAGDRRRASAQQKTVACGEWSAIRVSGTG